jgi:hypothetical protein
MRTAPVVQALDLLRRERVAFYRFIGMVVVWVRPRGEGSWLWGAVGPVREATFGAAETVLLAAIADDSDEADDHEADENDQEKQEQGGRSHEEDPNPFRAAELGPG